MSRLFTDAEIAEHDEAREVIDARNDIRAILLAEADRQLEIEKLEARRDRDFDSYFRDGDADRLLELREGGL